jgi:hypothetical protein
MLTYRLALAASIAALPGLALAAPPPLTVGSGNVAVIEPPVPVPNNVTPCTVPLYSTAIFGANNVNYSYTPPAACPGPWAKVVLGVNVFLDAGIQYDRTGTIWMAGVPLWFGTTAEPTPTLAPGWSFQKDVTEYSALFNSAQTGFVLIANYTNSTDTSVIGSNAQLTFYPASAQFPAPSVPDVIVPLANPGGGTVGLGNSSSTVSISQTLPTNIAAASLDVYLQGQSSDEFWYTCVPASLATELEECGSGSFREGEISIDGTPAGVAPVYPWIFTGGIDPYLWSPIPGVQTLNFKPFRVELSPFAGLLSNGQTHNISLAVNGAANYFSVAGALFLYLDHGSTQVTGSVTSNTLAGAVAPVVSNTLKTESNGDLKGNVITSLARNFSIIGTANLSTGPVTYTVNQIGNFTNNQFFKITDSFYQQLIDQTTTTTVQTSAATANGTSTKLTQLTYPLHFNYTQNQIANGNYFIGSTVGLEYKADKTAASPISESTSHEDNLIDSADTLVFDSSFNYKGHLKAKSNATFVSKGTGLPCFARTLTSADNLLTSATTGCKGSNAKK